MNPAQWHQFFLVASEVLGPGSHVARFSESWCSWTTFDRLLVDAGYWAAGIPARRDIFETHIGDGGVWGQPFVRGACTPCSPSRVLLGDRSQRRVSARNESSSGPGRLIYEKYKHRAGIGTTLLSFPNAALRSLSAAVAIADRVPRRTKEEGNEG